MEKMVKLTIKMLALFGLFSIAMTSTELRADPPGTGWTMTFSDEFNGQSTYDHTKWTAGTGSLPSNHEAEWYVDSSLNIDVSSGTSLKLTAVANSPQTGYPYSSGELITKNYFNQAFGYFECYAKVPAGKGVWPAFWHLEGAKEGAGSSWPPEIDTMEYVGTLNSSTPFTDFTTNHWSSNYPLDGGTPNGLGGSYVCSQDLSQGFHKFAVDWEPDSITWYMDDMPRYSTTTNVPYVRSMYMLLNLAIGGTGSWPGAPDANTVFPSVFEVDYVRAYSRALPAPWVATDIGSPINAGRTYASNTGLMNVMGCGAGITGTSDQFQFAYVPLNGDGTIVARVKNEVGTNSASVAANAGTLAGVMIRETLTGTSTYAMMALEPVVGGVAGGNVYAMRTTTSGTTTKTVVGNGQTIPGWLKVSRAGSTFTTYSSPDGSTWTLRSTGTITMATNTYIGLAVTSNLAANRATAQFDNISITGSAAQTLTSIVVAPTSAEMEPGSDQQFAATAYDQYRNPMTVQPTFTWSTTGGGTINASGLFSAGTTAGGPYTVTATSGSISGSATVSVPNVPNAPLNLTETNATMLNGWVKLTWTNNSSIATGYTIQKQNGEVWTNLATVSGTTTTYTNSGLSMPSGPYVYRVVGNGVGGHDSAFSNSVSATLPTPPAGPTGMTATPGANKVTVSWTAVSGASNYNVYRATSPTGPYSAIKYNTTATSWVDTTAVADTTYYYETSWNASAGGSLNSAYVSATPFGALTTITVTPSNPTVVSGSTQQYTAVGKDAGGVNVIPQPAFTWTATGGTINSSGLFTGITAGTFVVTATSGALNGTASATVTPGPLASITVTPSTATLQSGSTQQYTAVGKDANGNTLTAQPTFTWTTTGGSINSSGLFTGTIAGSFTITAASGAINGTANATVTPGPLATITLSPANPSVQSGTTQQFSALGTDANGNSVSPQPTFSWTATGGTINSTGLFTGTTAGAFTVTATSGSVNGTTNATVTPGPLATVVVTPASASVQSGSTQQYSAVGTDANGNAVTSQPTFTWTSTGGSISSGGLFTGTTVGSFTVTATGGGFNGTASATVTVGPLATITLSPLNPSVLTGGTQQFSASGTDANGNTVSSTYTWSTTGGGTISSSGLYTATTVGTFTVTATSGSVNGSTGITVNSSIPAAPTGLADTYATLLNGWFTLTWTDNSNNETGFTIQSYNGTTWSTYATVAANATTYTRTGLSMPSGPYTMRVIATNSVGSSTPSNQVTFSLPTPPSGPTGLTATPGTAKVVLSWTAVSGAINYNIERATSSTGPWTVIKYNNVGTTYTDSTAVTGTTYYYQVAYVASGGQSLYCAPVSATPN